MRWRVRLPVSTLLRSAFLHLEQDLTFSNGSAVNEGSAISTVMRALGLNAISAERLAGSVGNQTFIVRVVGGDDVILKIGRRDLLAAELWACHRTRGAGIPVPEVATHTLSPSDGDTPFIIMRVLAGEPTRNLDVWRQAGRFLRTVHNISIPGYGALSVRRNGVRGRHDTWCASLRVTLAQVSDLVVAGVLTRDLAGHLSETITSSAVMNYQEPGVMLHRDLKPQHIFGDKAELTGIIDWGDVGVGDPLLDIARVSMAGRDILTAFLDGYELDLTPELNDSVRVYRIIWNLEALTFEFLAGGEWFDSYRRNIEVDLGRRK